MNSQEADGKCIVLQFVIYMNVEQILLKSNYKVCGCSIHVVSLELSRR